jgi:hypothetical protein
LAFDRSGGLPGRHPARPRNLSPDAAWQDLGKSVVAEIVGETDRRRLVSPTRPSIARPAGSQASRTNIPFFFKPIARRTKAHVPSPC